MSRFLEALKKLVPPDAVPLIEAMQEDEREAQEEFDRRAAESRARWERMSEDRAQHRKELLEKWKRS